MAKDEKVPADPVATAPKKKGNLSESKSVRISISKYLQLHGSSIHLYTRAGLGERFRGIMKSKDEWDMEINKNTEGDK